MHASRSATAALLVLALHAGGCAGSFQVLPSEIPRTASGNRVATTDGGSRIVPDHFVAKLQLDERAGRLMERDDDKKRAVWVAAPFVEQAERDGWSETHFVADDVLEADFGTPEARYVGLRSRPRPPVAIGPHTTLWLRNEDDREAEVPLGAVESLRVDGKQSAGTKALWIVPVVLGGAVAAAGVIYFAASYRVPR